MPKYKPNVRRPPCSDCVWNEYYQEFECINPDCPGDANPDDEYDRRRDDDHEFSREEER